MKGTAVSRHRPVIINLNRCLSGNHSLDDLVEVALIDQILRGAIAHNEHWLNQLAAFLDELTQ
jgi:hypothetical protein